MGSFSISSEATFTGAPVDTPASAINFEHKIFRYRQIVQQVPESAVAWDYLGYYLARGKFYSEAIEAYGRSLHLNSYAARIWYNYGTLLEKLGCYCKAVSSYQQALVVSPS
ncbi:MAG: hypothetical protein AAGJ95_17860, partial [Cyanobacteria bacterium J06554_11]